MKVYISKLFASVIENYSEEEMTLFNKKINPLKGMNKTDILESDCIMEIPWKSDITLYAYNTHASSHIMFTIVEKNKLILFDEIELTDEGEIKSLVYPQFMNNDKQGESSDEND